jgi:pimeloyl-ACP methyl ester carboxylesterase
VYAKLMSFIWLVLLTVSNGPARAQEGSFDSKGVKIHYKTAGNGEPVVLIHGFAASAEMWDNNPQTKTKVFSELAKRYRVIALDCRGHGKSDKPHDPKLYGQEMVEDIVRLLDHLRIEKAHIVGYSMGAAIAGHLLVTHPERLRSVTLGGGVPSFERSKESLALEELGAKSLEEGKGIAPVIIAGTPPGAPKPSPELAEAISRMIIGSQDQKALGASVRGGIDLQVTEDQLKANRIPVLAVYGSRDQDTMQNRLKRVATLLKARVDVIEEGDHVGTYGMPAFLNTIETFIRKQKQ